MCAAKLAVVAVLFKLGEEHAALKPVSARLPTRNGEAKKLDAASSCPQHAADQHAAKNSHLTPGECRLDRSWFVVSGGPMGVAEGAAK
jgi:carbonic anhydrase